MFSSADDLLDYVRDLVKNKIGPKLKQIIPEKFLTKALYELKVGTGQRKLVHLFLFIRIPNLSTVIMPEQTWLILHLSIVQY